MQERNKELEESLKVIADEMVKEFHEYFNLQLNETLNIVGHKVFCYGEIVLNIIDYYLMNMIVKCNLDKVEVFNTFYERISGLEGKYSNNQFITSQEEEL